MPDIAPFRGLRYNPDQFAGRYSSVVAPPYDVLDANDKAALLARNPQNIVAVDLPHIPPASAGPAAVYEQAANTLMFWRNDQTLIRDDEPALYVYHQTFTYDGRTYTRKKFFATMRLEEFGTGTVFPHEKTFGGPKQDRFMLTDAARCQISPVFGLYSDPDDAVAAHLDVGDREPDMAAELDGVENRVWVVKDAEVIKAVASAMADRAVYIADGHHRYGTALNYRNAMIDKHGGLPEDHPGRFVFIGLCAMEDDGALILPTHRTISEFGGHGPEEVLGALRQGLDMRETDVVDPEQLLPARDAAHDLGIFVADGDRTYTARFTRREVMKELAPDESDAWRSLDLAYLHRFLIDECLTKGLLGGESPKVAYLKQADKAIATARETNGIALLCKACTMQQLSDVSHAGDLMPQKSTYFYPKLATGLVMYPLE